MVGANEPLSFFANNPFVVRIKIHADGVEVIRAATEFRISASIKHVPRFELRFIARGGDGNFFRTTWRWHNVNDRINGGELRVRNDLANCSNRRERATDELHFKLEGAVFREWIDAARRSRSEEHTSELQSRFGI